MPTIDGVAAAATLRGFAPLAKYGHCLEYVWLAYRAHGARSERSYPTAYSAWLATTKRHKDRNPPAGVPVWWGKRRSDGNLDGDVVISVGGGRVVATDQPTWGRVSECSIAERERLLDREYLGWSEDFLGNLIRIPKPTSNKEDDMPRYVHTSYSNACPFHIKDGKGKTLNFNKKGKPTLVSVITKPGIVSGNFYVNLTGGKATIDIVAEKLHDKSYRRNIGTGDVQNGVRTAIPFQGALHKGERLRVRVRKAHGDVTVHLVSARLLYWEEAE